MIFEKEEKNYLFVDAGYIKKCIEIFGKTYFDDSQIRIDYEKMSSGFEKIFYYDCPVYKKESESKENFQKRKSKQEEEFNELRTIDGFHVYEGTTKGRGKKVRQKQVDIMITVQMLMHTIRKNMNKCTLIAGDLDFKPLVDALVQEGMFVTIWSEKKSVSKDLIYASDARRNLGVYELWSNLKKEFLSRYPLPSGVSMPINIEDGFKKIRKGSTNKDLLAYLYKKKDLYLIAYEDGYNKNYFSHYKYKDLNLLEKFLLDTRDISINWD